VLLLKQIKGAKWRCMVSASKPTRAGAVIMFADNLKAVVENRESKYHVLTFSDEKKVLSVGRIPLPPYIDREPEELDSETYQTVYARHDGSVASPTAGLHFTQDMLLKIESAGIEIVYVTLHVGPGTFTPVRTDVIEDHAHRRIFSNR
jgi:S-adenosylmethionine:tRNA ribosyltransferase-isomerase